MHEESAGGFGNVIGGGVAEDDEFSEQRETKFGQIVVFGGEKGKDRDSLFLEVVTDSDPIVAGNLVLKPSLRVSFIVRVTVALVVMRTSVRVMDDHGLSVIPVGPDALAHQTNGFVKTALHRLRSVPIASRTKFFHEAGGINKEFLVACTRLYNSLCLSVGRKVGR